MEARDRGARAAVLLGARGRTSIGSRPAAASRCARKGYVHRAGTGLEPGARSETKAGPHDALRSGGRAQQGHLRGQSVVAPAAATRRRSVRASQAGCVGVGGTGRSRVRFGVRPRRQDLGPSWAHTLARPAFAVRFCGAPEITRSGRVGPGGPSLAASNLAWCRAETASSDTMTLRRNGVNSWGRAARAV